MTKRFSKDVLTLDWEKKAVELGARLTEAVTHTLRRRGLVVAVSGGVDSMALLDMLVKQSRQDSSTRPAGNSHLVVAHFDHGIRQDSIRDRKLVQDVAKYYELPFIYHEGKLGSGGGQGGLI